MRSDSGSGVGFAIKMKTGLILEGGALRGLFTAGALDVFMEAGLVFDGGDEEGTKGQVCIASRGKVKNLRLDAVFERKQP